VTTHADPDFQIGNLKIWVASREFPDAEDYWDGNWIYATATYTTAQSSVTVEGPFIHLGDIHQFRTECVQLLNNLSGTAHLAPLEPNLKVTLTGNGRGQLELEVNITPDHLFESHTFRDRLDQTYLPKFIAAASDILKRCPVKQPKQLPAGGAA
jgi:hypothetical protein